jgi:hypothetical protein
MDTGTLALHAIIENYAFVATGYGIFRFGVPVLVCIVGFPKESYPSMLAFFPLLFDNVAHSFVSEEDDLAWVDV